MPTSLASIVQKLWKHVFENRNRFYFEAVWETIFILIITTYLMDSSKDLFSDVSSMEEQPKNSMSASQLSTEQTEKLIQMYQEHECLWKVTDENYKDRYAKEAAFREIARQLGIPVADSKTKITNLRTQYQSEKMKLCRRKSGSAAASNSVTKWKWYSSLQFLSDTCEPRRSISSLAQVLKIRIFQ